MRFITLLFLVLFSAGCNSTTNRQKVILDKDTVITLGRTMCFGTCPAYMVTINGQGEVVFEGSKMVRENGKVIAQPLGTKNSRINQEQLQQIIAEFEKINFLSLKDAYDKQGADCPTYSTDSPSAITSIKTGSTNKTVKHYLGCEGKPTLRNLTALEEKIDEIVNTKQWIN